ncbi:hypothetical protein Cgig2_010442 [Carnegiea gigantea]|uniref:SWIM-type domain-containing protein n=1 Tax=Carnegiea gigantea TaxID=171969 RepID=A0A9Q1GXD4_9CARY|nr:hypothetical protein Cgig2_010442 [Carnegiea gigantea]
MVSVFRVTKNVVVHCKNRMITIVDVNLDMYQVIDLFRDVRGLAVEQGYAGFKWHPPGRENQRWPLNTDNDWVMLVHQWESIRGFVIPIYVVELHVPSQLQKVVESFDGLQKAQEQETVQFTSPCEPTLDPSLTEARMWADNLIVTPSSVYINLNAAVQVQPISKGTSHALKKSSTSGRQKLQIRRPIPRAAKDKPNASPSPSSLQPSSKQANTVPEPVNSPRRPLTRSQSSPSTKSAVLTTPSSSQPSEGLSQVVLSPTRPLTRSQTSPIPVEKRRTKSRPQPLNPTQSQTLLYSDQDLSIVRVDLDDFHDFDVLDLGQPQIPQLDAFDSDVDENVEEQVGEYLESDSEDSDFNVDEQEESDEVSLDDESDDNEVLDELDLELNIEQRMRLGHADADGSQGHVVVSKMEKVFKQGRLWNRNRDGSSASSRWVASNLLSYYRANSNAAVENMEDFIMTKYGVKVPKHTLWRGRKLMKVQGTIKVLKNVMPQASRRICVLHFYKNFAAHYPGTWFHCFFYIAANAYSSFVHLKAMDKIKQKEPVAYQWLRDNEPLEHWARFKFDANLKSTDNTNNFVESCTNFTVKLEHFCDCKKWHITGLPCKHSARCILRMKGQLQDYCAPWFSTDNYRKLYKNIIHPIPGPCIWRDTNLPTLDPPVELRKRGRPEKHNRREFASWAPVPQPEGQATRHFSSTKRCKQCKQLRYTSLTCGRPRDKSGRLLEKYKKKRKTNTKPVGRPRKTLCTTGISAGTSDPTSTTTEAPSQPNLVNLDCNILHLEFKCYEALLCRN